MVCYKQSGNVFIHMARAPIHPVPSHLHTPNSSKMLRNSYGGSLRVSGSCKNIYQVVPDLDVVCRLCRSLCKVPIWDLTNSEHVYPTRLKLKWNRRGQLLNLGFRDFYRSYSWRILWV